jgi:hypothetical protein
MKNNRFYKCRITLGAFTALLFNPVCSGPLKAQNPELQQRVAEIKQSAAKNKQALAQYTWVEQMTISLKGEQKKVENFQARLGPDGKTQKTSLDPPAAPPAEEGGRRGRLKEKVVAKKKEEYKDYAEQMKALAEQYVPPDGALMQQAYEKGAITLGPAAGAPNALQLIIRNYLKPQDSLTLVFDKAQKQLLQVQIASYMDDPSDAMNVTVQFTALPDGTNHVSNLMIDGVKKQLKIAVQNSNYQHL